MAVTDTIEINGEEREIADAYARGNINSLNNNLDEYGTPSLRVENVSVSSAALAISEPFHANANENITLYIEMSGSGYYSITKESGISIENGGTIESCENGRLFNFALSSEIYAIGLYVNAPCTIRKFILFKGNNIIRNISNSVGLLNESLDNQGLLNKVTEMRQGKWNISSGVSEGGDYYVSSKESISCNGNSNIKLKCDNAEAFDIVFFNGSSFISGESKNGSELLFTTPSNATSFKFNIYNGNKLTPQNVGKIEVYVDSQIEQLKSDLDTLKQFTNIGSINTDTSINISGYNEFYICPQMGNFNSGIFSLSSLNFGSPRIYVDEINYFQFFVSDGVLTLNGNTAWANGCYVYAR